MATRNGRTTPPKKTTPTVGFNFDLDKIEIGDMIELEEEYGFTLNQLMAAAGGQQLEQLNAKTLAALTFIVFRQEDPEFTAADARKISFKRLIEAMTNAKGGTPVKPRLANGKAGEGDPQPGD